MMAQRSGSVDPGLLLYVLTRQKMDPAELERALNERSGLLGVSGVSADMRQVLTAAEAGHERARLARDMFVDRLVSAIGAMVATLRGLDVLVLTGGIGEHSAYIREAACNALVYLGLRMDADSNAAATGDGTISPGDSAVSPLVLIWRIRTGIQAWASLYVSPSAQQRSRSPCMPRAHPRRSCRKRRWDIIGKTPAISPTK